jgi:hypothetical protein
MRFLRQSTASQEILLGPFVAAADGSAQTGLTIANTDIKLLVGGATSEANKNSGGGTHIAGGRYSAVLDATDTATVGILEVSVNPASGIPWNKSYYVMEALRFDSLFGSSASNPLFGVITSGTLQSATAGGAVLAAATSIADDLINNSQIEAYSGTGAGQNRVMTDWTSSSDTAAVSPNWTTTPDSTTQVLVRAMSPAPTSAGSLPSVNVGEWLGTTVATPTVAGVPEVDVTHAAGSAQASIATQASVNTIDGIVDDILVDTAVIGALGAGLTAIPWNAAWDAEVQSECTDALNAYDPPTHAELTSGLASADDAVLAAIAALNNLSNAQLTSAIAAGDDAVLAAIAALNNITVAQILAAAVDGSTTLVQSVRLMNAVLGAKASGMDTTTAVFRDLADTKNRVSATVDANGNRSLVTLDLT